MRIEKILKDLSEGQCEREKKLRAKVFAQLHNYETSRRELGRLLLELHDKVIGEKRFKEYVECLGIARRSAYRWMQAYKLAAGLPETIVHAADKKKMNLASAKYQGAAEEVPLPEDPNEAEANEWLDAVKERQEKSRVNPAQSPAPSGFTPEERIRLTSKTYARHCREMSSFRATYWPGIEDEERKIEVAQCLMGVAAAQLGITEPFTVVPDPHPEKSDRLVELLSTNLAEEDVKEEAAA